MANDRVHLRNKVTGDSVCFLKSSDDFSWWVAPTFLKNFDQILSEIDHIKHLELVSDDLLNDVSEWEKKPEDRADGFECLAFHRGKWRHVKWNVNYGWNLRYVGGHLPELKGRAFAHLPINTPDRTDECDTFYGWSD